jgi:hypothetical protein
MIGGTRLCEPLLAAGLGRFFGGARSDHFLLKNSCRLCRHPKKRFLGIAARRALVRALIMGATARSVWT